MSQQVLNRKYYCFSLTFDTFAALLESVDVGVDTALACDLIACEVGVVGRCYEVMRQGLGHVMISQRSNRFIGQVLPFREIYEVYEP